MPNSKDTAAQELGRKGGEARAANMTPEARSLASRKAVNARWNKQRKEKAMLTDPLCKPGVCSECEQATVVREVAGDLMCASCQAEYANADPRHYSGCICADCSGAELTADND